MSEAENIVESIADEINEFVSFSSALELIAKEYNLPFNASPLYNFRDALNHYKNLYESKDDIIKAHVEANSIREHLFRGIKDTIIYINNSIKYKLLYYSLEVLTFDNFAKKNKYRKLIHKLKNIELALRENSESGCIRDLPQYIDLLNNTIEEIKRALSEDQALLILKRRV